MPLTALDLGFANPQRQRSTACRGLDYPPGPERSPHVAAGAEFVTLSPAYRRWLAPPDRLCAACRSAEAEYVLAVSGAVRRSARRAPAWLRHTGGLALSPVRVVSEAFVPLAHVPTAGHTSTTHRRRQAPIVAAISAVAAAALVLALSLTGGPGKPAVHSALPPIATVPSGGQRPAAAALPSSDIASAPTTSSGSTNVTTAAQVVITPRGGAGAPTSGAGNPGAGNGTPTSTQSSPPPNNSPQPLQSVISLVSSVPAHVVAALP